MIPLQKETGIPLIGLGTWKLRDKECEETVKLALDLGYRHIDTADGYGNHVSIGNAIRGFPREKLFITSKIGMKDLQPAQIAKAVPRFLQELQTDYLDLLLIHWPSPEVDLAESLLAMLSFKEAGLARAIGVSNFVRFHFEDLKVYDFPIAVNQVEMHPFLQRKKLVEYCRERKIAIVAYRPLAKGAFEGDPFLNELGKSYGKSASQIALRWLVQQNIVAIPKAASPEHLKANLNIFDFALSDAEMRQIEALDIGKRFCQPEGFPMYED